MTKSIAFFLLLSPLFFLSSNNFLYPELDLKMFYFSLIGLVSVTFLVFLKEISFPSAWILAAKVSIALSCLVYLYFGTGLQKYWAGYYLTTLVIAFTLIQMKSSSLDAFKDAIIGIASIQAILIWILPSLWTDNIAKGFLGNAEFFSTLMAVGFLLTFSRFPAKRPRLLLGGLFILGILAARSIGTASLLILVVGMKYLNRRNTLIFLAGGIVLLLGRIYLRGTGGIGGRLFLYWIGGNSIGNDFIWGIGPHSLKANYFIQSEELFLRFPQITKYFSSHTSLPNDFHSLPLQLPAEFGVFGLASLLFILIWLVTNKIEFRSTGPIRTLLLLKSIYTVVLASVTSATLILVNFIPEPKYIATPSQKWLSKSIIASIAILSFISAIPYINASFYYVSAIKYEARSEYKLALSSLDKAIFALPDLNQAHLLKGKILFAQGEQSEGSKSLERAIASETSIDTLKQAAALFFHYGRPQQSAELNKRIILVYPEHVASLIRLAQAYVRMGMAEEAMEIAQRIKNTQPRVHNKRDAQFRTIAEQILITKGRRT